ncbi:hypothetical protein ACFX4I_10670 [Peribacillus sp. YIM B13472]|uniref:hypothetical protein n=1 Tax=Peribacillus sp. YIM B13472 TaxID=3366297 RepID=UPI00366D7393
MKTYFLKMGGNSLLEQIKRLFKKVEQNEINDGYVFVLREGLIRRIVELGGTCEVE